ncbi:uncharacterized protein LOC129571725 [Sitodiplosis mosellana]|uniref:uncharacterized protein LOC129571725 n=1 Tax=Sitodiplosis mosellana TaxID=263140 RepID=UPI0024451C4C|nr:uncharacterized protein LOC129571725 [Sitodiplosis mosellana]
MRDEINRNARMMLQVAYRARGPCYQPIYSTQTNTTTYKPATYQPTTYQPAAYQPTVYAVPVATAAQPNPPVSPRCMNSLTGFIRVAPFTLPQTPSTAAPQPSTSSAADQPPTSCQATPVSRTPTPFHRH